MSVAARRALQSYGAVHNRGRVEGADPAQLIMLLFDAAISALRAAELHIARGARQEKCDALEKASEIVLALQGSLDQQKGGELADTLDSLYSYCLRRIIEANAQNSAEKAAEVRGYLEELHGAWESAAAAVKASPLSIHDLGR